MNKITLYTNNTCPYCKQVKEELNKQKVKFEDKLTEKYDDEFKNIYLTTGSATVPAVECGGEYFFPGRDFNNPEQLVALLKSFRPIEDKVLAAHEKVKTLSYSLNMAFVKLDKVLSSIENKLNTKK